MGRLSTTECTYLPTLHSCRGRGCAGVVARRCPLGLRALRGPRSAGVVGAVPGGWPATFVRSVWCQALSLPRSPALWAGRRGPPPTCCGRGRAGLGARHRPLGLHARWELRAAGLVGGRPRGPATVARGVWCQTLSLPQPPALWGG